MRLLCRLRLNLRLSRRFPQPPVRVRRPQGLLHNIAALAALCTTSIPTSTTTSTTSTTATNITNFSVPVGRRSMLDGLVPIRPLQLVVPMSRLPCQFGLLRLVLIAGSPTLFERGGCCDDSSSTAQGRRGRRSGGWRLRLAVLVMALVVGVVPLAGGGAGGGALPRLLRRCGLRLRQRGSMLVPARPPHAGARVINTSASTGAWGGGVMPSSISITCGGGGGAHVRWAPLPPLIVVAGRTCAVIVVAHTSVSPTAATAAATDQVRGQSRYVMC